jgi:hypothetical protein
MRLFSVPAGIWLNACAQKLPVNSSEVRRSRRTMAAGAVGAAACPYEVRARLSQLRDEIVSKVTGGRHTCARSREWAALPLELRMAVLLLAGVDGEVSTLARRAWLEMPGPEREAVRGTMRGFARALNGSPALVSRWGDD